MEKLDKKKKIDDAKSVNSDTTHMQQALLVILP